VGARDSIDECQTKPVTCYHMTLLGTFDEELIATLAEKLEVIHGWETMAEGESKLVKVSSQLSNFQTYHANRKGNR